MEKMKPFIRQCRRCKKWEICYPTPGWEGGDSLTIEGFNTWREALEYALKGE